MQKNICCCKFKFTKLKQLFDVASTWRELYNKRANKRTKEEAKRHQSATGVSNADGRRRIQLKQKPKQQKQNQ